MTRGTKVSQVVANCAYVGLQLQLHPQRYRYGGQRCTPLTLCLAVHLESLVRVLKFLELLDQ